MKVVEFGHTYLSIFIVVHVTIHKDGQKERSVLEETKHNHDGAFVTIPSLSLIR